MAIRLRRTRVGVLPSGVSRRPTLRTPPTDVAREIISAGRAAPLPSTKLRPTLPQELDTIASSAHAQGKRGDSKQDHPEGIPAPVGGREKKSQSAARKPEEGEPKVADDLSLGERVAAVRRTSIGMLTSGFDRLPALGTLPAHVAGQVVLTVRTQPRATPLIALLLQTPASQCPSHSVRLYGAYQGEQ